MKLIINFYFMATYKKVYQGTALLNGTTSSVTVPGVLASDCVMARINSSANTVTVDSQDATTDTVSVTFSAAPGAGEWSYVVTRVA